MQVMANQHQRGCYLIPIATQRILALDMREWLGGEEKIWEYCHGLAVDGTRRLAEILGTQLLDKTENLEFTTMMVSPFRYQVRCRRGVIHEHRSAKSVSPSQAASPAPPKST